MYSFLIQAAPRDEDCYQFFTYRGRNSIPVFYRGREFNITSGSRFGVRATANNKFVRMIFAGNKNRVFTLDIDTAKQLANGVGND